MTPTRRRFLQALPPVALARQIAPELILHGATVHTMDRVLPRAQAVAVAGGRILAVGSDDEILPLAATGTVKTDLTGRTVVPGFIDAHTHPVYSGIRHLKWLDCDLRSIAAIQQVVRERASRTAPGEWIVGFKYDDTKTNERRKLTRRDLDEAAPGRPVFIQHRGGHTAFASSAAFQAAGVTTATPDPPGGRYVRGAENELTGEVAETANDVFWKRIPTHYTREELRRGAKLISEMMTRAGVTSVTDAEGGPEDLRAYHDARDAGELAFRVYCFIVSDKLDEMMAAGVRTGFGDDRVRVGAVKLVCDGSISERTAFLSEPYIGRPDDRGILVTSEEELYEQARKAHLADWQIGTHANGDAAIDITLRVYERLQREHPRPDPRFRLEHCTVVNDSLVKRIRALGAIPNPFSTYVYYHGEKMRHYGPERLNRMFAVRSFLDAGVPVTQTSDYPPGPFEPMMALQSSVTRTDSRGMVWGPAQRITVEEALRVGTIHGAYASHEETVKGSIEPGKLADLVVLGRDPTSVDPFELMRVPVERTMVGGRWVYEA